MTLGFSSNAIAATTMDARKEFTPTFEDNSHDTTGSGSRHSNDDAEKIDTDGVKQTFTPPAEGEPKETRGAAGTGNRQ